MVFSPRLFSNKREPNSKMVATKAETVMNDCVLFAQTMQKNGERVSMSTGKEYNRVKLTANLTLPKKRSI